MKTTVQLRMLLAALLVAFVTSAQVPTGTISGVVQDESGAVVPGAQVTITNKATGAARTLTAGQDGAYTATLLPAGTYEVRATMTGFRTLLRDATVETGSTTAVDMRLQVGQSKE